MSRFLEDEQDELLDDEEREEAGDEAEEEDEEGYLEGEETLEELDTDDRGHVRPRRRSRFDEEIEPEFD
jgi:hypothetical protein